MKNLIVFMVLMSMGAPVLADVVYPEFTPKQREEMRQKRYELYKERQRQKYINSICGTNLSEIITKQDIKSCKSALKKEYEKTVKMVEKQEKETISSEQKKQTKENKNDAEKVKNAAKQY